MKFKIFKVEQTKPWFTLDAPHWLRVIEFKIRVKMLGQPNYLLGRWTVGEDLVLENQVGEGVHDEVKNALINAVDKTRND